MHARTHAHTQPVVPCACSPPSPLPSSLPPRKHIRSIPRLCPRSPASLYICALGDAASASPRMRHSPPRWLREGNGGLEAAPEAKLRAIDSEALCKHTQSNRYTVEGIPRSRACNTRPCIASTSSSGIRRGAFGVAHSPSVSPRSGDGIINLALEMLQEVAVDPDSRSRPEEDARHARAKNKKTRNSLVQGHVLGSVSLVFPVHSTRTVRQCGFPVVKRLLRARLLKGGEQHGERAVRCADSGVRCSQLLRLSPADVGSRWFAVSLVDYLSLSPSSCKVCRRCVSPLFDTQWEIHEMCACMR